MVRYESMKERGLIVLKNIPRIQTKLREHYIAMPECIKSASGIVINGRRIKSLIFSTDVALISNCNADAVIAVYPFTPTLEITQAIINVAKMPVFTGVGGGTTSGERVKQIALDAELHGALAVVLNAPTASSFTAELAEILDIPIVLTIVSEDEDIASRLDESKASIVNVSGGKNTANIIRKIRLIDKNFPIIATGGPSDETIIEAIACGANAITYTPPSNGEIFRGMMENYRKRVKK